MCAIAVRAQFFARKSTNSVFDEVLSITATLLQLFVTIFFFFIHFYQFFLPQITNVISKRLSKTDYNPLIKSGRINLCEFFKNPEREQFLKSFFIALRNYGDLMFACPMKKVRKMMIFTEIILIKNGFCFQFYSYRDIMA